MFGKLRDIDGTFLKYIEIPNPKIERTITDYDVKLSYTMHEVDLDFMPERQIETDKYLFCIKEVNDKDIVCSLELGTLLTDSGKSTKTYDIFHRQMYVSVPYPWTYVVKGEEPVSRPLTFKAYSKPIDRLCQIRDAYMYEMQIDSKNKKLTFCESFGSDKGAYFIKDLNMTELEVRSDTNEFCTVLRPIGKDGLTIESVNQGIDNVRDGSYVGWQTATASNGQVVNTIPKKYVFMEWEDSSYEDAQRLMDDAKLKLADMCKPKVSYSCSIRDLARTSESGEYANLEFDLGDTVWIISRENEVREKQRVVRIVEYPDNPYKNEVELSNTVLSWEEYSKKLRASQEAMEANMNADGTINGVKVVGVPAEGGVTIVVKTTGDDDTQTTKKESLQVAYDNLVEETETIKKNKVLWTGALYMTSNHTVEFSNNQKISEQTNGIVLLFGGWDSTNNKEAGYGYSTHFIPKEAIVGRNGRGFEFMMGHVSSSRFAVKYLYIGDDSIGGHDQNTQSGTKLGITYNNANYVLLKVIGV